MSIETTINCDGIRCIRNVDCDFSDVEEIVDEIIVHGWSHDVDNDFHYCPTCTKKIEKETGI